MQNTKKDWIKTKLKDNKFDKQEVYALFPVFQKELNADNWGLDSYKRCVRTCYGELIADGDLSEDVLNEDLIKLEAQNQKRADLNNLLRKSNREGYRFYNSIEELYKNYVELLQKVDLSKIKINEHKVKKDLKTAILQLSDLHCNELITSSETNGQNEYNFDVLSKRLKKFITESMREFDANNVTNVLIAMTGDLLNSSRRKSELLAMATSLTCASLLLTYILEQVIIELSQKYNVSVTCVVGNESRLDDFMDSQCILASTNYDFLVYNNLRLIFEGKKINFITPKNYIQNVVPIKIGKDKVFNALFLHGHTLKNCSSKDVPDILQSYIYSGIKINGIFIGHKHNALIGDLLSMSGSLCGANAYSFNDLKFITRASQNIFILNDDLSYKGIKIDLQDVSDYKEGYDIKEELEQYVDLIKPYNNTVTIKNYV